MNISPGIMTSAFAEMPESKECARDDQSREQHQGQIGQNIQAVRVRMRHEGGMRRSRTGWACCRGHCDKDEHAPPYAVMAGLVPAIHTFTSKESRGCPRQARA